jgi:uncharacterized membrane protein (UPF0127 family)
MISRKFYKRSGAVESRFRAVDEPLVIRIAFVNKDGKVVDRMDVTVPAPNDPGQRTRPWQRKRTGVSG